MCGISGWFVDPNRQVSPTELGNTVQKMSEALFHRGPDSHGFWMSPQSEIGLGHRRLAIIDLTAAGHQPMPSSSGRFVVTFNGEIYNYRALKSELIKLGSTFKSSTDTEVLLEGIEVWGLNNTLQKLNGMFAFGLWDQTEKDLYLVRDRIGEKPLYYGQFEKGWFFSSEIKSFHAAGFKLGKLNQDALGSLFHLGYIAGSQTIYERVLKLPPGHVIKIPTKGSPQLQAYWSAKKEFLENRGLRSDLQISNLKQEFKELLFDATRMRLESDVPVGAFLSGGIDSSLVVSAMSKVASSRVSTFTVGFPDWNNNESKFAAQIAKHLGTDHHELQLMNCDLLDVVPQLANIYDEPFADASQIPTILISRLTKKHVTVCLSGDGGDEVFWGYPRYWKWRRLWKLISHIPGPVRGASNLLAARFSPKARRALKGLGMLGAGNAVSFYEKAYAHWLTPIAVGDKGFSFSSFLAPEANPEEIWQLLDTEFFLPDDILVKVDRAGMAVALENRIPLLDHRIVEFGWSLSERAKIHQGQGKFLMRQLLYDFVPQELVDRPKQGFGVPMGAWLRGPLRDWAETLLNQQALQESGLLRTNLIYWHWKEHLGGSYDFSGPLWSVLMFQQWFKKYHSSL